MGKKHNLCPTHKLARDSYKSLRQFIRVIHKSSPVNLTKMAILKSELTCSSHQLLFRLFLIDLYTSLLFSTEAQLKPVIQSALHHQLGVYPGCREPCHGQGASSGPQAGKSRSKRSQTNVAHRTTQSFPCNTPIPRRACTFAASRSGPPGLAWPPLTPGFGEMPIIC